VRLFLAIDPGDTSRRQLATTIDAIQAGTSGVRWVKPDKLHITMAFLGEVDESRVQEIAQEGQRVAARHAPFAATVSGAGVFPNWRQPRVVWLGIPDSGALDQLGTDINSMCTRLGYPPDHPFRAHLTIGRVNQPLTGQQRDTLRKALETTTEPHLMNVTRVSLMRSTLGPGGSAYSELASMPLGGA
jgi:RNA 2',3'-cyclic 3'-phosphodiesterase